MNKRICAGCFLGGEIEPGTFHRSVMVDPRTEENDPASDDKDITDAPNPTEGKGA